MGSPLSLGLVAGPGPRVGGGRGQVSQAGVSIQPWSQGLSKKGPVGSEVSMSRREKPPSWGGCSGKKMEGLSRLELGPSTGIVWGLLSLVSRPAPRAFVSVVKMAAPKSLHFLQGPRYAAAIVLGTLGLECRHVPALSTSRWNPGR